MRAERIVSQFADRIRKFKSGAREQYSLDQMGVAMEKTGMVSKNRMNR